MSTRRIATFALLLVAAALCSPHALLAQSRDVPPVPEPPERPAFTVERESRVYGTDMVRIGQDYLLGPEDTVDDVTIIMGNARIEGRALGDVTVILGTLELAPAAVVEGSLVVLGGSASIANGARVDRDIVSVGGKFDAPPGFVAGGEHVVVGTNILGERLQVLVPWVTRGLLWGRPIVPGLRWVWSIVGLFFLFYLAVNLVFHRAVRTTALTLKARPLTSLVAGLLVLVLAGPFILLLAITIVGIVVVPIVVCAIFVAALIGKVGIFRSIGMTVVEEQPEGRHLEALRSYAIGFAVLVVAYMVPVLGFAAMALVAVMGLGGATLSFMAGYRQENPLPPPRMPTEPTPPPVPPPAVQSPVTAGGSMSLASDVSATEPAAQPLAAAPAMSPAVAVTDLAMLPHAPFLDRLGAFVLDVLLVMISWQFLWPLRRAFGPDGLFLTLLIYHIGFWTWKGTTVGGIICQLRLVKIDGAPLQFVDAFVRGLSSIFSLAVFGLGGLWILKDPDRQAWHDRIAGTFVVKVPRNWPI